ncbi:MAG: hypothetical protein HXX08_11560 [Chloroflexi bacterium]|uniref:RAD52 family DNA repair protein n=1 Tax=Candidatus Chlorohelix allophototropha TaxID=3003348 RepID=A0A8T7LZN3_9CHLR|nr:hypothetical protein [Chloroflexota bacterium]WJW65876.1 RAD52 family DNA repair protein [Chloroflexota bacterium L227-S17]
MLHKDQIALLREPLDKKRVKSRKQGGKQVTYLPGHDVIDTANRIFGEDGWGYTITSQIQETITDMNGVVTGVLYTATVRLEIDGCKPVEDVGTGFVYAKEMGTFAARSKGIKQAITDALKRCFRVKGVQFGNGLYDDDPVYEQDETGERKQQYKRDTSTSNTTKPALSVPQVKSNISAIKSIAELDNFYAVIMDAGYQPGEVAALKKAFNERSQQIAV